MKTTLPTLILLATLTGCTQHASMTTAQIIKNRDCNQQSEISYKRCDTNVEDEYQKAQELKRELDEQTKKEQEIEQALKRANQKNK